MLFSVWLASQLTSFHFQQLMVKMETLYAEISNVLEVMEQRSNSIGCEMSDKNDLKSHVLELKAQLKCERNDYIVSTLPALVLLSKYHCCYIHTREPWKVCAENQILINIFIQLTRELVYF